MIETYGVSRAARTWTRSRRENPAFSVLRRFRVPPPLGHVLALMLVEACGLSGIDTAWADEPTPRPESVWQPRRMPTFEIGDWMLTGTAASLAVATAIIEPQPRHWRGGILFDESVRDALRPSSIQARYTFRDASDVGVSLATAWPILADAFLTAWWYRGRADLAQRIALVDAEAFAVAAAVQGITNTLVSRERPYGRECGGELSEQTVQCENPNRYRSFFSGHSTLAFTAAGVTCVHHLGVGLLGPPGDAITCVAGYGVAAATALFRVAADMHYMSDVLVGSFVGTAIGLTIPLLHLGEVRDARAGVSIRVAPVGQGLGVVGTF
jgi:membrane-associated phospholipid phosphatase